ncbi:MAG: AAA family ATPase [Lewinellaceae bacterium]|nr:AAA family ATPase [Saprospiraceae bacterium]MCB9338166.1 AAA family ATPase [Lewinellaceae bacterium]
MNKPFLLLIAGLPASGKTWLARHLADKLAATHINSDNVRTALGLRGQYGQSAKQAVYNAMLERAGQALQAGEKVIVDSTFYKKKLRQAWMELALKHMVPFYFIEIKIPETTAFQRLQKKREDSEADWEVYQKIKKEWEPLENPHLTLDAGTLSLEEMTQATETYLVTMKK